MSKYISDCSDFADIASCDVRVGDGTVLIVFLEELLQPGDVFVVVFLIGLRSI